VVRCEYAISIIPTREVRDMARQNVFWEDDGGLAGWFDTAKAECFNEATRWNGNNHISVPTGSQWAHEELYHTVGGRWVKHAWSQWQGTLPRWTFVSEDEAQEWLLLNEEDEAVGRLFGDVVEESGPGRPEIGPAVHTRLPEELLAQIDADAKAHGESRAEAIRRLLAKALPEG
jgi:hypothetical protein